MIPGLCVLKREVVQLPHVDLIKVRPFRFREGRRNVSQVEVRSVPLADGINAIQIIETLVFQQASNGLEGDREGLAALVDGLLTKAFQFSAAAIGAIDSGRPIERRPPRSNDCQSSQ
jgi:hypothetical protein